MTFDTVEQSQQSATPVELYDFVAPVTTWRLTTYQSDVVFGGNTYSAVPGSRSNLLTADAATDPSGVTVQLPASHALSQQYVNGIPMRDLQVTITRYHPPSGVWLQMWQGYATSLTFHEHMATFFVPSGTADALGMDIPAVTCSRLCNNILYDGQCQVARASFQSVTTITSISADGKTIGVAAMGSFGSLQHGEILHAASQERRTITGTSVSTVTVQGQFPNGVLHVGDAVTVFAGCDHQLSTCKTKFNNVLNFGGLPYLPPSNIFYVGLVNTRYHF